MLLVYAKFIVINSTQRLIAKVVLLYTIKIPSSFSHQVSFREGFIDCIIPKFFVYISLFEHILHVCAVEREKTPVNKRSR